MNHAALFNGIGGFQLAAEWMGWNNVMSCEIDEFCNKITKYHFPNCIQHGDIKKTDFTIYRGRIDIITGGFPCQPYSAAGKRKGKEDDRHLWPEMLRAISEIRPRWIVGENVSGLLNWNRGMVLDEIKADLEAAGFEVFPPLVLPACAVNAPHRRDRVWIVAHANSSGSRKIGTQFEPGTTGKYANDFGQICSNAINGDAANTPDIGHGCREKDSVISEGKPAADEQGRNTGIRNKLSGLCGDAANTGNQGLQGRQFNGTLDQEGQIGRKQPSGSVGQFCEITDWINFPTQSPICSRNDGLPGGLDGITFSKWRNESIKAFGNAIVWQVVFEIFKAIQKIDHV